MNKEKKTLIKYLGIMVASCLLGGALGFMSAVFDKDIAGVIDMLVKGLIKISPRLMFLNLAGLYMARAKYRQGKDPAQKALTGDEAAYDEADEKLEQALEYTSYVLIYSFGVFGIMAGGFYGRYSIIFVVPVIAATAEFLFVMIALTFLQRGIVNRIKQLNPEKQGDVLDLKFQQEWFDSCDEAEKALIGKAAYAAYKATTKAIVIMWVLAVFAGFLMPVGPLPAVMITLIWFVQTYTYMKEARQNRP